MKRKKTYLRPPVKKILPIVDNCLEYDSKRVQLYNSIKEYNEAGYGQRKIAKLLHCGSGTVAKYLQGDFESLCKKEIKSSLNRYFDYILKELHSGSCRKDVYNSLIAKGYQGSQSTAYDCMGKLIQQFKIDVAMYKSQSTEVIQKRKSIEKHNHLSRTSTFKYLWMGVELSSVDKDYLWKKYPSLKTLTSCIREFREIYERKSMPLLYIFVERYKESPLKQIARFACGLEKDIEAVENSVASHLSNGLVEGINSKLKMVKRTMYGRCSRLLLSAKMMYDANEDYG